MRNRSYPRDNEKKLRDAINTLKSDLRSLQKVNRVLKDELDNIAKPVRPRRQHVHQQSIHKMTREEWRRDFIRRFRPRDEVLEEVDMDIKFTRVVVESPFAGNIEANVAYARLCVRDCLARGEAPLASHLLYTQPTILDDSKPEERKLGINAGFTWNVLADRVVVYTDRGVSRGMEAGIALAQANGIPVEYRKLEGYDV